VYVYSVSEDVMGSSVKLGLRVSGVVGPSADWGATSYTHSVEIFRWGTMNVLGRYSGTGPET